MPKIDYLFKNNIIFFIFYSHNEFKFPILRWIHESINNNPEKTIICPDCGKEYKLKDIHNSILMSPQIIEKYNEDVLKN